MREEGGRLTFLKALHMSTGEVFSQKSLQQRRFAAMMAFRRARLLMLRARRSSGVKVRFQRRLARRCAFRSSVRWGDHQGLLAGPTRFSGTWASIVDWKAVVNSVARASKSEVVWMSARLESEG